MENVHKIRERNITHKYRGPFKAGQLALYKAGQVAPYNFFNVNKGGRVRSIFWKIWSEKLKNGLKILKKNSNKGRRVRERRL